MSTTTPVFDAAAYKTTTRDQWEQAAEAWHRWGPVLEAWLGEATETMLDLAEIGAGSKVLDVAAGAGGQSLAAARRVGPWGAVLAPDVSPAILGFAEAEASLAAAGIRVAVRHAANSAALLFLPEARLDLVRPGIMLYGCHPRGRPQRIAARMVLPVKRTSSTRMTILLSREKFIFVSPKRGFLLDAEISSR
jgi:SAM-dependent methyltransferase